MPIDALSVLCAQLSRNLLAIAKFLFTELSAFYMSFFAKRTAVNTNRYSNVNENRTHNEWEENGNMNFVIGMERNRSPNCTTALSRSPGPSLAYGPAQVIVFFCFATLCRSLPLCDVCLSVWMSVTIVYFIEMSIFSNSVHLVAPLF